MSSSEEIIRRWKKAFPLADFPPALKPPSDEERRLAQQFCPLIYTDNKLIREEHEDLARNLGVADPASSRFGAFFDKLRRRDFAGVADALFIFRVGKFPKDLTGAKLGVLSVDLPESELPWDKEMHRVLDQISERIRKEYAEEYQAYVNHLFETIFPENDTSTCVIKYRVVRHPVNSNIYCIQYFSYWPVQLLPRHLYDFEPFYVIVRKEGKRYEPLLATFNADYGAKPILSGKRPGHIIRTFFNWDSNDLQITPDAFNPMADYMTKAYGGSYYYQPVSNEPRVSHIDVLYRGRERFALYVPRKWHSYDLCSSEILRNNEPLACELHPLKTQDLLHIEWEVRNPFQAPFLYPTVGKKNALMHFPLNIDTFWKAQTYKRWSDYALYEYHIKYGRPSRTVSNIYAYRVGLFIDLFSELSGESIGLSVWPLVEARERELKDTLSLIERLKRRVK